MPNEYAKQIVKNHRLFDGRSGLSSWPEGYNDEMKKFILWLDEYEQKTACGVRVMQVKMKFGYLTIYIDIPEKKDESGKYGSE